MGGRSWSLNISLRARAPDVSQLSGTMIIVIVPKVIGLGRGNVYLGSGFLSLWS